MFNEFRSAIARRLGELVRYALPIGGVDESGAMSLVSVDANRLRAHFAFQIGGASKVLAVSGTPDDINFAASSGSFLRVLSTTDCYVRVDATTKEDADDPATDSTSIFLPYGETVFLLIPDTTEITYLSAIQASGAGTLYASIVS